MTRVPPQTSNKIPKRKKYMTAVARAVALAPRKKKKTGNRPNVSGPGLLLHPRKPAWAVCATHVKRKHQRWQGRWPPLFPKDSNPPTQASKKERNRKEKNPQKPADPLWWQGRLPPHAKKSKTPGERQNTHSQKSRKTGRGILPPPSPHPSDPTHSQVHHP